jgi:hypothetical protein
MKGEIYLYFCKYYVLDDYVKEKLMKLTKTVRIKNMVKLDSGLHENILFMTPRTDEGQYDTRM